MNKQVSTYPLRLPPNLRRELEARAEHFGRTLRAEILSRLEESLAREDSADYATGEDRPTRDEVLNLLLHGMTAGLDAFERARDQGASSADMHRRMKQAIIDALREDTP